MWHILQTDLYCTVYYLCMVESEELSEEKRKFLIESVEECLRDYKEIFDELDKV